MRRTVLLLVLALAPACRDFRVPDPPKLLKGSSCTADAECESQVCATEPNHDPICCEKVCADDETCVDANHKGSCTVRLPGTACAEEKDCPQAMSCVDGVCCLAVCAPWQACNLANHLGTCTNRREFGEVCTADEDCPAPLGEAKGHCVKGVCCVKTCEAWETCVNGGKRCEAPRSLGDACKVDAECPPPTGATVGFCVDDVCCDGVCGEPCTSCARPGLEGACGQQEINSDLRDECGFCEACFWGSCQPAIAGTSPKDECAAGKACDISMDCGVRGGGACAAGDRCAVGSCLEDRCLRMTGERVEALGLSDRAGRRDIFAFDQNGVGDATAMIEELVYTSTSSPTRALRALVLLQRNGGGPWTATRLDGCDDQWTPSDPRDTGPYYAGGVAMQGRTAYLAGVRNPNGVGTCEPVDWNDPREGVWGQPIAFNGERGAYETIDAEATTASWVFVRAHPKAGLVVAYDSTCGNDDCIRVRKRVEQAPDAGGGHVIRWESVFDVVAGTDRFLWEMELVDGVPTVALADGATLALWQPGSSTALSTHPLVLDLDSCAWPATANLILSRAQRTNPATGAQEEGLSFSTMACPTSLFRMEAALGSWWPSTGWLLEPRNPLAMTGLPVGGERGGAGVIWDDLERPVDRLEYTWLDAAGNRLYQQIFTPPDFQDLTPVTGVGRSTPTGDPVFLVAGGDPAIPPVPRNLYLVQLHP